MEPASVMESLTAIANVVGLPACLLVGWLFMRVKQISSELESLKKEMTSMQDKHAEEIETIRQENSAVLEKLYDKMNSLAGDVAFIRGRLEREK